MRKAHSGTEATVGLQRGGRGRPRWERVPRVKKQHLRPDAGALSEHSVESGAGQGEQCSAGGAVCALCCISKLSKPEDQGKEKLLEYCGESRAATLGTQQARNARPSLATFADADQ
ncbi:hypothetical protein TRVL_02448 [Trypanosoma vivax]|nr:hypothetical protein TRVL_02448 [Trypanosoma vivax]